ncbi:PAC2 family protein [Tautonia plasticadhaerens]|uniref:PAC2 family protein n=1 Tax=Tautonia plasticadhaerens TaxID=2527974 RepID=A0A518HDC4_9BACT|nr:PAC2 family protein [Tautonia plasticadhaerens]QDV38840.1 PAC2 family protein [Tautonia plasticadhaerens]
MADEIKLNKPWMVAVWPGMGHVAISAGYYLMAKLGMHLVAELQAEELFDVDHVEVKHGLIRTGRLPRSRFFAWVDPLGRHDLVVFIGEAQPPRGKHAFCSRLVDFAKDLGVERVFTFASMATQMHPSHDSRVFGAATDRASLDELTQLELTPLEDGHISGLNGVLLGVAAEAGLPGTCLLGEMPHIFAQLPFPKAALSVLEVFATIAAIQIDLTELSEQAADVEEKLGQLLSQVETAMEAPQAPGEEEGAFPAESSEEADEEGPSPDDRRRIDRLFDESARDRAKAYELKRELDRLGVYHEYEDRFLDLFKKSD